MNVSKLFLVRKVTAVKEEFLFSDKAPGLKENGAKLMHRKRLQKLALVGIELTVHICSGDLGVFARPSACSDMTFCHVLLQHSYSVEHLVG